MGKKIIDMIISKKLSTEETKIIFPWKDKEASVYFSELRAVMPEVANDMKNMCLDLDGLNPVECAVKIGTKIYDEISSDVVQNVVTN